MSAIAAGQRAGPYESCRPAGRKWLESHYRLRGAIVENPGGNVFLKFTKPERTIAANVGQLLDSFRKE
jgi:hypothetical protein